MNDVFNAPNFKITAHELRDRYQLSAEAFEEHLLLLEFNFICCLSYNQEDDRWQEVVTPFHEWRHYLLSRQKSLPSPLPEGAKVVEKRRQELAFAKDINALIATLQVNPLPLEGGRISTPHAKKVISEWSDLDKKEGDAQGYIEWLTRKLCCVGLGEVRGKELRSNPFSKKWLEMTLQEQALSLYRHPTSSFSAPIKNELASERNFREMEKTLNVLPEGAWVRFKDYQRSVMASIGSAEEPTLKKVNGRWSYVQPTYTKEEEQFIRASVLERFFEAGFVSVGICNGEEVFRVTPFGKVVLG
jgi:hypothetical protein